MAFSPESVTPELDTMDADALMAAHRVIARRWPPGESRPEWMEELDLGLVAIARPVPSSGPALRGTESARVKARKALVPAVVTVAGLAAALVTAAALDMGPVTHEEWQYFAALSCRGEFIPPAEEMTTIRAAVPWFRRRAIERELARTRTLPGGRGPSGTLREK